MAPVDPIETLAAKTGCSVGYVQTLAMLGQLDKILDNGDPIGTRNPHEALRQLERRRAKWENEDT